MTKLIYSVEVAREATAALQRCGDEQLELINKLNNVISETRFAYQGNISDKFYERLANHVKELQNVSNFLQSMREREQQLINNTNEYISNIQNY